MAFAREFANSPALNGDFVESNPTTRQFAVTDPSSDHIKIMAYNSVKARRLVSKSVESEEDFDDFDIDDSNDLDFGCTEYEYYASSIVKNFDNEIGTSDGSNNSVDNSLSIDKVVETKEKNQ